MEYGHVCFAYSKNEWIAKAIAWVTKSQWSHSFFTAPPMLNREMAMEAASTGTSMTPFDVSYRNNPNQKYEVYRMKCDPAMVDEAVSKCMDELETMYGYEEFPWFMWRSLLLRFGKDIKAKDNWSQQGIVCSGYVRHFISYAGYDSLFAGFGKNSANAQDVYNIVKAHPELFELIESKD
jgi:hypothetical protein